MIRLADKHIVVPHWHVSIMPIICLSIGLWTDFIWLTGIGLFFAGLLSSIFLPIWKEVKSEKDMRYLAYMREARGVSFYYWGLPIISIVLVVYAVVAEFTNGAVTL
ncbi:hypothetical protein [Vibrio cincinnatiensis]|uniref:hypothetical protein n=1 Tax=Vibrio cincinnatiensis TaxID=675 RepID=UPI001EDFBD07|nr:hypothetical protein [Vibrio cincinnatiensis]MCG3740695.1 hypothetical protein [Vibrio cincinnatiensis]